jgi:hypothetical protein
VFQVLNDIRLNGIHTYEMPPCDEDDDEEYKAKDQEMKVTMISKMSSIVVVKQPSFPISPHPKTL